MAAVSGCDCKHIDLNDQRDGSSRLEMCLGDLAQTEP